MYLEDVEPVLRAGMDYLRDEGREIVCFANRNLTVVDGESRALEKSCGMSWWKELGGLERWAESHPTRLVIFGAAMNYLRKVGAAAKLKQPRSDSSCLRAILRPVALAAVFDFLDQGRAGARDVLVLTGDIIEDGWANYLLVDGMTFQAAALLGQRLVTVCWSSD